MHSCSTTITPQKYSPQRINYVILVRPTLQLFVMKTRAATGKYSSDNELVTAVWYLPKAIKHSVNIFSINIFAYGALHNTMETHYYIYYIGSHE